MLSLLLCAACDDPREVRGPRTEPVQSVPASRVDLGTGASTDLTLSQYRDALIQTAPDGAAANAVTLSLLKMRPASEAPDVVVVKLPKTQFSPTLLVSKRAAAAQPVNPLPAVRPSEVLNPHRVLVGSSFVAGYSPLEPLGLLQVDGVVLAPLQPHGYTRILGVRGDELGVVHRSGFERGLFESALQVGPGIVERSLLDINAREQRLPQFIRSFVGTCRDHTVVGVTLKPEHLYDLGQRLVSYFAAAGLACDEVANLSGDRETLLVLPDPAIAGSLLVFGNLAAPKTVLMGFDLKSQQPNKTDP